MSRTIFNKKSAEGAAGAKSDQASDVEAANDGDENVTPAAETSAAKSSGPPPRTSGHPSYYSEEAQKQRKEKVKVSTAGFFGLFIMISNKMKTKYLIIGGLEI